MRNPLLLLWLAVWVALAAGLGAVGVRVVAGRRADQMWATTVEAWVRGEQEFARSLARGALGAEGDRLMNDYLPAVLPARGGFATEVGACMGVPGRWKEFCYYPACSVLSVVFVQEVSSAEVKAIGVMIR